MDIVISSKSTQVLNNGVRRVLIEFLYDLSQEYVNIDFHTVLKKYVPGKNPLSSVQNMSDLYSFSIKELQIFLASYGCKYLSGAKVTLVNRLWKFIHSYSYDSKNVIAVDWDKSKNKPSSWKSIWVIREKNNVGKCVSSQTPHATLYKVDTKQSPSLVYFETNTEYIIEGTYDDLKKQVKFGNIPEVIKREHSLT